MESCRVMIGFIVVEFGGEDIGWLVMVMILGGRLKGTVS